MKAVLINCTLKRSPATSNTEALALVVAQELESHDVAVKSFRIADYNIPVGVETDMGEGDQWPVIHDAIVEADILVFATPTWVAHPSSLAQKVLERMDAMLSETDDENRPIAFNKVAGVVVTGNEDGAHHVIGEVAQGLFDIGFTIPGQAWTYWNMGPGPGDEYLTSDHKKEWSASTGKAAARNLVAVANALNITPIPATS